MATVSITCPACRKRIKGRTEHLGRKIRCPGCQEPFVAEEDAGDDEAPLAFADDSGDSGATRPAKPDKPKPSAAVKTNKPAEPVDNSRYGIEDIETKARCPNCAELMVDPTAIICIHCGYNTLTRTYGKTKRVYAHTGAEIFRHLLPALICTFIFLDLLAVAITLNTVLPAMCNGRTDWREWFGTEAFRMWMTMICLGIMWWLGGVAFKTFALHPLPEEVEKE
jgi:Zn finger protein HypA/HybF involved in hydrogenase expression